MYITERIFDSGCKKQTKANPIVHRGPAGAADVGETAEQSRGAEQQTRLR